LELATDAATKAHIYGQLYGEVTLSDGDGTITVDLDAHNSSGGELELYDGGGSLEIELYAGASTNDLMVNLPDNSINADEIQDEPGLGHGTLAQIMLSTSLMDITSVELNVPASGYVYVFARCDLDIYGHTENSGVILNISSTADISFGDWLSFTQSKLGYDRREPSVVDAVFYCSTSGAHTFAFEGSKLSATGSARAMNVSLTAFYYPTSYAAVKTLVSDPGDFPDAVPVPVYDNEGNPTGESKYEVDLRNLEIKAKQERIEALEAELELQKARENESRK